MKTKEEIIGRLKNNTNNFLVRLSVGITLIGATLLFIGRGAHADPSSNVTDMGAYWWVEPSTALDPYDKSQEDTANLQFALNNATSEGSRDVNLGAGNFVVSESILILNYQGTLSGAGMDITTILGDGTGNPANKEGRGNPQNVFLRPTDEVLVNINLLAASPTPGTVQTLVKTSLAPSVLWFIESRYDIGGNEIDPQRQNVTLRDFTIGIKGDWYPNTTVNPSLVSIIDKDLTTGSTEATRIDANVEGVQFKGKKPEEGGLNVIG